MNFFDWLAEMIQDNFITENRYRYFARGLMNTMTITLFAAIIGVVLGTLVAIVKEYAKYNKKLVVLEKICNLYTTVVRGTPIVVQLFIMYFIVFASTGNGVMVAIFALGVNSGAYVAEIVRGGIGAVDIGQSEAGRSLGLNQNLTMRHIVLPQAVKGVLPALGNEFISLLKETSVVGYLAIEDLMKGQTIVTGRTNDYKFNLIFIALIYLILVLGFSALQKKLERRMAQSDRH